MSWSAPVVYSAAAPQLGVPAILDSDPLLQFKGARSVIKSLPAATGSSIGPSSQVQFLIPQSMNGYIKPGSMYLKCKIVVTQTFGNTGGQAPVTNVGWTFAGQCGETVELEGDDKAGPGGASSVIDRLTVTFPGGVQMSYPMYDKFHWGLVLNHMLSREYVSTDLKMLEMCRTVRDNGADSAIPRTVVVCIPLDLPVFNSPSAVPLLLLSGGITLDLVTNAVAQAFTSVGAETVSSYAMSEMTLVYEELQVSPEFKTALQAKVAAAPYSIGIADRTWLGLCDGSNSTRVNIGVGLSSMKALVGLTLASSYASSAARKESAPNGLIRWNFYVNGSQVNSMNLDTDVQNYAEFTRAIQSLYDVDRVSDLRRVDSDSVSCIRSSYQKGQFAFGLSTAVYNDANFALSGIPVDQLSVEFERGGTTGDKWGVVYANATANWVTHLWALHDSVLTVLPDGTVSLRK